MAPQFLNVLLFARRPRRRSSGFGRGETHRRLAVEQLEDRTMLSAIPFGAAPQDTAEYMLGDVSVTLVLMESDGSIDPSTEDWTPAEIASVKETVNEGLRWWEQTLALQGGHHSLHFIVDDTYADHPVPTGYEPISRPWDDYSLWVEDFLHQAGFDTAADLAEDVLSFNQAQRLAHGTDWSFTIFVANSSNDPDDRFELGHELTGSFAFAGGLFFVTPSGRPPSTIAHETGHIFYAKDEYPGGGSYSDYRGYYNTQNLNAWDGNPDPDSRVDSIMSSGAELQNAYANHLVSPSAKEMVGWRDSDSDGVFDVLGVPHTLQGSGALDPRTQTYRFIGESSVQTLPNRNSSGLGNDITINEISRAEYSLDGADWQTAAEYHTATAYLDVSIPVTADVQQIAIRTIDDASGVTSNVFRAAVGRPESTAAPGINGFVWVDVDGDGPREVGEPGLKNWTVALQQPDGSPLPAPQVVEPDAFPDGAILDTAVAGVTFAVETVGGFPSSVGVAVSPTASTGQKVLAYQVGSTWSALWTSDSRRLKIEFASAVSRIQIDAAADTDGDCGRLEVFDANDQLLARFTSGTLSAGRFETLEISRPTADIAYALVGGHLGSQVQLDNLRIGVEPTAKTDGLGAFSFTGLDSGAYLVEIGLRPGWTNVSPQNGRIAVVLGAGEVKDGVDFGVSAVSATSLWQNPANTLDADDDGLIAPADVLWIARDLYYNGSRRLPAPTVPPNAPVPYLDTNGDGYVSPVDVLLVARYVVSSASLGAADEVRAAPLGTPTAGSQNVAGERAGSDASVEGEVLGADGSSPPANPSALRRFAASTAAPVEGPATWSHLEAVWPISVGFTGRAPSLRSAVQMADQPARRENEPLAPDTRPSYLSAEPTAGVLREAGEGALATLGPRPPMKDESLSTDEVFSEGAWLEDLLPASLGETSWALLSAPIWL